MKLNPGIPTEKLGRKGPNLPKLVGFGLLVCVSGSNHPFFLLLIRDLTFCLFKQLYNSGMMNPSLNFYSEILPSSVGSLVPRKDDPNNGHGTYGGKNGDGEVCLPKN